MNITCPNCGARSKIADERVPAGGAWARCPKCQSRFIIRPAAPQADDGAPLTPEEKAQQSALRQRILRRVRGSAAEAVISQNPEDGAGPEVFVFPEPALSEGAVMAMGLALLAIPLIMIGLFFKSASSWQRAPETPPTQVAVISEETRASFIKSDLLWLRRQTMRRSYLNYTVNYTGSESRLFKHYAGRLIPSVCRDITAVTIHSPSPLYGFIATATCLEQREGTVDLKIDWVGRSARLSFPQYNVEERVELFSE